MSFGLTNASTAFQQFMNNIFSDLLDVCVIIYLDDVLIYLNNMSEHHWHVKEVLKRLRKAGLYAKAEKCKFHSELVEYLGYILSLSGLTMSNDKVKIIQDWPDPKKVKDIQSFLGFANFYHRFIFNYSDIVIPLTCLTQKDIPWKFDSSCQDAFNSLKKAFTSAPTLTYWIPNAQLIVETDASDHALAVILSIVNKDNKVHPVAFHSHTFTVAELNYDTHDKELLAIFEALKIWRHYLEGPAYSIDVVMDHKNLEYFSTTKVLMIHNNINRIGQTFQIVSPNLEGFKDGKQFLVMCVIVQLCRSESARVKSNWMNFIIFINNREDWSKSIV